MKRITDKDKQAICQLVEEKILALGSANNVAKALNVNPSTVTNSIKPENWNKKMVSANMWVKLGSGLGYKFSTTEWVNVEDITNTKAILINLRNAQELGMCMGFSEKGGSGKTTGIDIMKSKHPESVFVLQCDDWSKKQLLLELCQLIGVNTNKIKNDNYTLSKSVIGFFKKKTATCQPMLIFDEADKLKPDAFGWIIPLYNKLKRECGIVIFGSKNLQKQVENKSRKDVKGYDEIYSRIGRKFIELPGANRLDTEKICTANGVTSKIVIDSIFQECNPIQKQNGTRYELFVEDMRRIERLIIRELKKKSLNPN